ncbi:hypothetical protein DSM44344_04440 [Mycobacterium marinum]|nr:hypothetical protein DSM44344_04440 [Mycobacterium marinum]
MWATSASATSAPGPSIQSASIPAVAATRAGVLPATTSVDSATSAPGPSIQSASIPAVAATRAGVLPATTSVDSAGVKPASGEEAAC